MDLGSSLLSPYAGAPERHFKLGRRMVDSCEDTMVARAVLAIIRIIGPKRALERMARNLRTTNNDTESRFETLPMAPLSCGAAKSFRLISTAACLRE